MFAKKSLGQNFLKSEKFLNDIVNAAEIKADDIVLEVGPGKGVLTEKILSAFASAEAMADKEKAGKVFAVEKDDRLIEFLRQKFAPQISAGKLEIIHADILEFEFCHTGKSRYPGSENSRLDSGLRRNDRGSGYKIVANIPYYITGTFLRKFLSGENQPSSMTLLLQKEVAERIVAKDPSTSLRAGGKESLLSVSVKAYGEPKFIEKVPKRYFSPAPKVDSAIISIKNISKNFFADITGHSNILKNVRMSSSEEISDGNINDKNGEKKFFEIVRAGFAHKRKILLANLKTYLETEFPSERLEKIFEECEIPLKARAEDLTLEQWKGLIKKIIQNN